MFYWALLVLRSNHVESMLYRIGLVVVFGAIVVSGWAIYDYMQRGGGLLPVLDLRANLPFSGPQWLSTYAILTLPVVAMGGILGKERWIQAFCWLTVFIVSLSLFYSLQRGAWLAFLCQAVLMFILIKRKFLPWIIGAGVVFLGGVIFFGLTGYYDDLLNTESIQYRWAVWKLGIQQLLTHPFVGIGYGNDILIRSFSGYDELANAKHLHNIYLMMGVGSGFAALLIFVWLFVKIIAALIPDFRNLNLGYINDVAVIGILVTVVGFAIRNIFDYMLIGSMACLFWFMVAGGFVATTQVRGAQSLRCSAHRKPDV